MVVTALLLGNGEPPPAQLMPGSVSGRQVPCRYRKIVEPEADAVRDAIVESRGPVGRELVRLSATAVVLLASLVAVGAYVPFLAQQGSAWDASVPYGGWQVVVADAFFGVAILALLVVSARATLANFRRLRGRTPHRRLMFLIALLPGLFAGGALTLPADPIVTWASNHTAEAAHWRALARQHAINYRKAPPSFATGNPTAPTRLAARLLTTELLGQGWYDISRPNPASRPVVPRWPGVIDQTRSSLTQQHWNGSTWSGDAFLIETMTEFHTVAEAETFLTSWTHPATGCACGASCNCTTTPTPVAMAPAMRPQTMDGIAVWIGGVHERDIAFQTDNAVFSLVMMVNRDAPAQAAEYEQLLRTALKRAAPPKKRPPLGK